MAETTTVELAPLGQDILKHWKAHRPRMCAALERKGLLEKAVYAAQEMTLDAAMEVSEKQNLDWAQAMQEVREEWAYLPDEATQPELSESPEEWIERSPNGTSDSPTTP